MNGGGTMYDLIYYIVVIAGLEKLGELFFALLEKLER